MASYYEVSNLEELLNQKKEELSQEMTVKEVLEVLKNSDEHSETEVNIASKAVQMIVGGFANYLNRSLTIPNTKLDDISDVTIDPKAIDRLKKLYEDDVKSLFGVDND